MTMIIPLEHTCNNHRGRCSCCKFCEKLGRLCVVNFMLVFPLRAHHLQTRLQGSPPSRASACVPIRNFPPRGRSSISGIVGSNSEARQPSEVTRTPSFESSTCSAPDPECWSPPGTFLAQLPVAIIFRGAHTMAFWNIRHGRPSPKDVRPLAIRGGSVWRG